VLNTVYRLVSPRQIEAEFKDVDVNGDNIIVRPTHLSICHADQRYFQGSRPPEILKKKLPMALIHEAIGKVVFDPQRMIAPGTKVVMVPNTPVESDEIIAENYLRSSKFRASGYDGFMQDVVSMRRDRVVVLPEGLDNYVAAFTELVSVSNHTIDRFLNKSHSRRNTVGVWGDGNVAYITALLLKKRLPETKIVVFGKHEYKMHDFMFADKCFNIGEIPQDMLVDHAFECVGGVGAATSINQIIDFIQPEGCIATMGVSEDNVPINTRMVLEKGLTIFGSSRSGAADFVNTLNIYKEKPEIVEYLSRIVGEVVIVNSINDMLTAFDRDFQRRVGKTIMVWEK
jgi:ribitol-5-phosphate 2-dehydrogenase